MVKAAGTRPSVGAEFLQGWRPLTAATVGIGVGVASLPFYTFGLFIPELEAEFGWSRSSLSSILLVGSLINVLLTPLVGAIIDRYGVRVPSVVSLLALGASFLLLARTGPSFSNFLLLMVAMYVLALASSPVSFTRAVNERFDRARGVALGIALAGAGLVAFFAPQVLGGQIAENWRAGYRTLGIVVLVGAVVVGVLMPNSRRLASPAARREAAAPKILPLLRTTLFARLAVIFFLLALAIGGLTVHLVPMQRDAGVPATTAASTAGLVGIALIVGRLVVGLLVDRFFAPKIAAGVLVVTAAGLLALLFGGPGLAVAAALGLGVALGGEVDVMGYLIARYYDLAGYGRLFGVLYAIFVVGTGLSPLLISWLRAATGGYDVVLIVSVGLLAAASALLMTAPRFPASSENPAG
ncbi:MFS transporter [Amycolatopsis sp. CA-126428]|uniref:MFS transporter n=1 Tax=Amycolatopsis sp. CA-126428 TaxID=2073158 RepID=UPI000CD0A8F5|nr:MFS transporter [Amycolatopsis sp. CA-126428]